MIVITGGAGFIGSHIAKLLYQNQQNIVIIDDFNEQKSLVPSKWNNIRKIIPLYVINVNDTWDFLERHRPHAIVHMGAISDTTCDNITHVMERNITYSQKLWHYVCDYNIPFIYASSASTYGDGSQGFDAPVSLLDIQKLQPLNLYGWSKNIIDYYILEHISQQKPTPSFWAGLKFFNVFGPNEYHKHHQSSVVPRFFHQIQQEGCCRLFESAHSAVAHGEQKRDFVYVKDCAHVIMQLLQSPSIDSGIYNCGTGQAHSFYDMACAIFHALGTEENIHYIAMPDNIKEHYQYYTQAGQRNIIDNPTSLHDAVADYIQNYLTQPDVYC